MPADPSTESDVAIAIVGIGGLFAASESPEQLWANVLAGTDATGEVPDSRWPVEPHSIHDPRIALPDHIITTRGGFVDAPRFDPAGMGLESAVLERLDPAFHLALAAASQAWRDARTERIDPGRAGVVFGNI